MKAAILTGYRKNGCDLVLRDVPVPEVSAQEVLVKVHTTGVNPLDNMIIHGIRGHRSECHCKSACVSV